jgi:hypothetical protein
MIRPWEPERDMPMLGGWLRARGQAVSAGWRELYPETGFVVDDVAIGFLYRTDAAHVGWLDGVVTDPYTTREQRAQALGELIPALYAEADRQGLRLVFATTAAPSLVELGKACGARILQCDHVCLARTKE